MILSYTDLIAAWNKKRIRFTPDIVPERQIGLSSVDLRLGTVFAKLKPREGLVVQPARGFDPTDHVEIEEAHGGFISGGPLFRLAPREVQGRTPREFEFYADVGLQQITSGGSVPR